MRVAMDVIVLRRARPGSLRITHLAEAPKGLCAVGDPPQRRWRPGQQSAARMSLKVADGRITAVVFSASGR